MAMARVGITDVPLICEEQTGGYPGVDNNPIITVSSNEVAWLFGIDDTVVEQWVNARTLTPCSKAPDSIKTFWRKDIAELLIAFGA
jgi:hypothetical protein